MSFVFMDLLLHRQATTGGEIQKRNKEKGKREAKLKYDLRRPTGTRSPSQRSPSRRFKTKAQFLRAVRRRPLLMAFSPTPLTTSSCISPHPLTFALPPPPPRVESIYRRSTAPQKEKRKNTPHHNVVAVVTNETGYLAALQGCCLRLGLWYRLPNLISLSFDQPHSFAHSATLENEMC